MMAAAIRNMTPADLPAIEAIEPRIFEEPWDMGSYAACLRSGCYARVAEEAGTVAGYAVLHQLRGEAEIFTIGVAPEFQGKGIGKALLADLMDEAKREGAFRVVLQVRSANDRAIHIYKNAGFVQAGVISDYYTNRDGTREDALFMEAMFTHA